MRLSVTFLLLIAFLASCDDFFDPCTEGNGNIVTWELDVNPFQSVTHEGNWDVTIIYDSLQSVSVTGDENIIERIERDVDDGEWEIEMRDGCYRAFQLEMEIRTPFLNDINLDGSGDMIVEDISVVQFRNTGTGEIMIRDIFNDQNGLFIISSGSGNISAISDFNIRRLNITSSGSGNLELFQVQTDTCHIELSGSGNAEVSVNDFLDCHLSGSGNISYKGYPLIQQNITGSGRLIDAN